MPTNKKLIQWRDVSGGNVTIVSSDVAIQNTVPFSMNLLYDKVIGQAVSREGTNIVGAQLASGKACLGLFQHVDTTFANSKLFAAFNGSIYNVIDDTQDVTSLSTTAKYRFATFLNTTLALNGVTADARVYAGSWASTGGNLDAGNLPANAINPIEYKDRMYCSVDDNISYTTTPTSAGVVSWTSAGSGSIQVEQEDGGGTIRGLNKVPGYLMIYKRHTMKRWNFSSTFPEDLRKIGTPSGDSIVSAESKNFFFSDKGDKGFYETTGGYPVFISRAIQRIIDGIPSSFYGSINGWSDDDHIYWSVGDITVDFDRGFTEDYNNVVLRYTIATKQWAPLSYAHEFRALAQYINGDDVLIVGGDTDGQVLQLNTGNSDYNGNAITYILQSPEFVFGNRGMSKTISQRIIVHSDGAIGAMVQKRIDYGEWEELGTVKDIATEVKIDEKMKGNVFEFRIVDSITGEQIKLRGIDFPSKTVETHDSVTG